MKYSINSIKNTKLYKKIRWFLKYRVSRIKVNSTIDYFNHKNLRIEEFETTINRIKDTGLSLARFGDGEFSCMSGFMVGKSSGLNSCNQLIRKRLLEVINSNLENLLIGIIPSPSKPYGPLVQKDIHWNQYVYTLHFRKLINILNFENIYSDATIFLKNRLYDSNNEYFIKIIEIWTNKSVCFVTSSLGRLDINHDLFSGVASKHLIDIPNENAFEEYDSILNECLKLNTSTLFLLSAGFTATILAHDLTIEGYQAIDIGHITHNLSP
jgi:hypothetical protein